MTGTATIRCRGIVNGAEEGEALVTAEPINFLAMVDACGTIRYERHELHGRNIAGKVLVFPNAIGSSVGAYSIYELRMKNAAPKAMICKRADITTASGCAIAGIPLVDRGEEADTISAIRSGSKVRVDATNGIIEIINA